MRLLQSSAQQISPNLKEYFFPGLPNTEKNIREAVCVGGQKEGVGEREKVWVEDLERDWLKA